MDSIFSSLNELRDHIRYCPDTDFKYGKHKGRIRVWPDGRAAGTIYIDDLKRGTLPIERPEDVEILPEVDITILGIPETIGSGRYPCQV